jgi:chromate transporter
MNARPSFGEATRLWLKIGCIGFGGPSGQIAILHREVVEKRAWIGEEEFVRALRFCMLLPGPEAQQLATWIGWRIHGLRGGIAAGTLFLLPAVLLLWCLGLLYVTGRDLPAVHGFFTGIKPAVTALVLGAVLRIGKRTLTSPVLCVGALLSLGLFLWGMSYPLVLGVAALIGALLFPRADSSPGIGSPARCPVRWRSLIGVPLLWFVPVAAVMAWLGTGALPVKVAWFFAKVAVLSFGGAYAALSYVSLHASGDWGWITPGEMMDGLGLAETTPGPLLIALQFVAFLACWHAPGVLSPLMAATLGSLAAVWSLFLPSFLWIFSLAPVMDALAANRRVGGALSAIGAVVTAVIATLGIRFALPLFLEGGHLHPLPLAMGVTAFWLLQSGRAGILTILSASGLVGMLSAFLKIPF